MNQTQISNVRAICQVKDVIPLLNLLHHAYPVYNSANKLVGLIPKKMIVILLEELAFYRKEDLEDQSKEIQQKLLQSARLRKNTEANRSFKPFEIEMSDVTPDGQRKTVLPINEEISEDDEDKEDDSDPVNIGPTEFGGETSGCQALE